CKISENLVALGTFEPDIFIYDAFTEFPVLPKELLIGHKELVTTIKNQENRFMSGSEDQSIIEWDLNKNSIKEQLFYDFPIDSFDFSGSNLAYGAKNILNVNNNTISLENE